MTKIHKKIVKARHEDPFYTSNKVSTQSHHNEGSHHSAKEKKAGVAATINSHDFRFRDEATLEGMGLDSKAQKRMAKVKKMVAKR